MADDSKHWHIEMCVDTDIDNEEELVRAIQSALDRSSVVAGMDFSNLMAEEE